MSEQDRIKLAIATLLSISTVGRWARGERMKRSTELLLNRAATELGLSIPVSRRPVAQPCNSQETAGQS